MPSVLTLRELEKSNSRSLMSELRRHGYQGQLYPSTEGPLVITMKFTSASDLKSSSQSMCPSVSRSNPMSVAKNVKQKFMNVTVLKFICGGLAVPVEDPEARSEGWDPAPTLPEYFWAMFSLISGLNSSFRE